ncbi:hypothetical protein C8F01DRAFT_663125 [Mycena amicta]|nr:hypothetical protein C8F01DRAFT_663125 [Mycena amicta]
MDDYEYPYSEHPSTQPIEDAQSVPVECGDIGGNGYSNVNIGHLSAVHILHPTVAPRSTSFGSHLVPHWQPSNSFHPHSASYGSSPFLIHQHHQGRRLDVSDSGVNEDKDAQDVPMQSVPQPRISKGLLSAWNYSATEASSSRSLQASPGLVKLLTGRGKSGFLPEVPSFHILGPGPENHGQRSAQHQDTVQPPLSFDLATFPTSDSFLFTSETLLPGEDLSKALIKDNPLPLLPFRKAFKDALVQDMLESVVNFLALRSHSSLLPREDLSKVSIKEMNPLPLLPFEKAFKDALVQNMLESVVNSLALNPHSSSETRSTRSFSTHSFVPSDQSDYAFHTAESSGDAHTSPAPFSSFIPAASSQMTSTRGPQNKSTSRRRALSSYARTAASTSQSDGNTWAGEQVVIPPATSSSSGQSQWTIHSPQPTRPQAIAGPRTVVGSAAGRTAARTRRNGPNKPLSPYARTAASTSWAGKEVVIPPASPQMTSTRSPRKKSTSRRRALSPYARTAASTSQSDGNAWAGEQVVIPPATSSSSGQSQWTIHLPQPTRPQAIAGPRTVVGSAAGRTTARTRRKEPNKRGAYICKSCKANFTTEHNLKVHYKSHSGQKDGISSKCDQSFVTPHVRNCHEEKCLPSNGIGNGNGPSPA